ncbi:MAG: prephenate dehydratase [Rikenellaceae bacterium]|jgi:prephenate dehydratase|nr:prephenate dehydratase [Rikenellaceae bacterium]
MKEKQLLIAIQGHEGCFHQIVAEHYFGHGAKILSCNTFRDVARAVEGGQADFGVMAIENSIAGSIIANYSILQNSKLQVCGETYLHVRQHLMALPGVALEDIEEVHSHPMALLQCMDYLEGHPWKLVEKGDTALAAKMIASSGPRNAAAVAGARAAELYGMNIIQEDIHTIKNNYTRFCILRRATGSVPEGANKASLYFKTYNERGSLLGVLRQLEQSTINMTKLQSYPIPSEPWHYLFHVDMEFGDMDEYLQVMGRLALAAEDVHIYGVYKKGDNI